MIRMNWDDKRHGKKGFSLLPAQVSLRDLMPSWCECYKMDGEICSVCIAELESRQMCVASALMVDNVVEIVFE